MNGYTYFFLIDFTCHFVNFRETEMKRSSFFDATREIVLSHMQQNNKKLTIFLKQIPVCTRALKCSPLKVVDFYCALSYE